MTSTIKVDTIQTTSGNTVISTDSDTVTIKDASGTNTAMTINSDGYVFTPDRPSFSVYYDSSGVEGVGGSSATSIAFTGVYHNTGSHYDTSTGKFTAPVAGLYQFNFVGFGSSSSGGVVPAADSVTVGLYSDTTTQDYIRSYGYAAGGSHHPNLNFASAQRLVAGEKISVRTFSNNYVYSDSSDEYLAFSGYLVG